MKKLFLPLAVISMLSFSACGGGEQNDKTTEKTTPENTNPICFYEFDKTATTSVKWTAFKTSAKVGVGGQFTQVNVTGGEKSTKVTDVLNTIKFNINTGSTETGNEDRDEKIVKHFFGTMNATDLIIGQVKSSEGTNESGTCNVFLTINNQEKEVVLNYAMVEGKITLTGEIDILNWGADDALAAMNEACKDLHKGEDGVSVTWPNVELSIETTLKKDCH